MNDYRLYVKISDTWKELDLGDEKPAMNYQSNDIAELKNRQADYSQALKLPLTENNVKNLEQINIFEIVSSLPYNRHECRLFLNESVIAGTGSYMIIDSVDKTIDVQILSGIADLFKTLSESKLSAVDLGYYPLGSKKPSDNYVTADYCIPYAVYVGGAATTVIDDVNHAYPFAYLKNAIEKILTANGYTLQTNLADADWNAKAINICSLNPTEGSYEPFSGFAELNTVQSTPTGYLRIPIVESGIGQLTQENPEGYATQALQYKAIEPGIVNIIMNVSRTTSYNPDVTTLVITNMTTGETLYNNQNISHAVNINANVEKDDVIRITLNRLALNPGPLPNSSYTINVNLSLTSEIQVPVNGNVYISPNLGFDTQLDLFKSFVQLYGLTVYVDNDSKVVYAYTMQKIYDNKIIARDWSRKMSTKSLPFSFSLNSYAQENKILFENNDADGVTDYGTFTVNNQTIEKTKDLFTLKFEAGKNGSISIGGSVKKLAHVPLEELDSEGNAVFKGGKPHIVDISSVRIQAAPPKFAKLSTNVKVQSFIDSFYDKLVNGMLVNAKIIEPEFELTEQDIEEYRRVKDGVPGQFVPVYVDYLGAYFYVNKIKNFISDKLTKVELVKL